LEEMPVSETQISESQESPTQENKPASIAGFLWEIFQTLAMALILFFLVDTFMARARVENISMLPNLRPGEFLLVNKFAYQWGAMHRGDIIVFHAPTQPGVDYVKRLIGEPGDMVKMQNGQLYINGEAIKETYISMPATYSGEWKVPAGMIFALGDNRDRSDDSHVWGFVPVSSLVGKGIVVYFPLDQIKLLNDTIGTTP
jgi:signal peptidase I